MIRDTVLFLHIAGGSVAIVAGYAALASRKGSRPHRIAGNAFFLAMLMLGATAAPLGMVFGGLVTCYLVATAWLTVGNRPGTISRLDRILFACVSGMAAVALVGSLLISTGAPLPGRGFGGGAVIFVGFAGLCAALDLKMIRAGGLIGFERTRRHLWRMCAAMFVATGSFFLGQMDEIPQALHGPHLWVLALAPLVALAFWMARTRPRRPRLRATPAVP